MLLILIGNAIRFTNKGYIHTTISINQSNIQIEVEDTGIGIKEESKEKIFHLFSQVNQKIANNQTGIGFRLSLCRDIVSMLKGSIFATPKNVGCIFTIILPIVDENSTQDNEVL